METESVKKELPGSQSTTTRSVRLDGCSYVVHVNTVPVDVRFVDQVLRDVATLSQKRASVSVERNTPGEISAWAAGDVPDVLVDEIIAGPTAVVFMYTTPAEVQEALKKL